MNLLGRNLIKIYRIKKFKSAPFLEVDYFLKDAFTWNGTWEDRVWWWFGSGTGNNNYTQFYDSFYNTWFKEFQCLIKCRLGSLKFICFMSW